MTIRINDQGYIETDLFTKANLKNQLLLPYSAHPAHIPKNIVYSLALRIVRICSETKQRDLRLKELEDRLRERRYHPRIIKVGIERARQVLREEALKKVIKGENTNKTPKLIVE